jgi:ribosomal protein S18 acetylase RimI-like enzyme
MDRAEIDITSISMTDLRADPSGGWIRQMAALAYRAFREPPWNDDLDIPRLQFGLGVDLMRRNARAVVARHRPGERIVGYLLGYEVLRTSEDHRDLTLADISGTHRLDELFEDASPMFYWDTLCVDRHYRKRGLAHSLALNMIGALLRQGFRHIGRTSVEAAAMRNLFTALGFQELPIHDVFYPDRTYWLLACRDVLDNPDRIGDFLPPSTK